MSKPLPTFTLDIQCQMRNPARPIGVGIFDGKDFVGVATLEELRRCVARLDELQAADRPSGSFTPEATAKET